MIMYIYYQKNNTIFNLNVININYWNFLGIFFESLDNDDVRYSIRPSSTFTEWYTSQVIDPFLLLGPRTEKYIIILYILSILCDCFVFIVDI